MTIKADKPTPYPLPNEANRSFLADVQLPGAQMHPRGEEDGSAPPGCPGVPGGCPASEGWTRRSAADGSTRLSHTPPAGWPWRWPRGQPGHWTPRPATVASLPSLLAKVDLPSPSKTGKFSTATYLLKQPLCFSVSTRTELGQHPRPSTTLTAHSPPSTIPRTRTYPQGGILLTFCPVIFICLGFFFLLQDLKAPPGWGSSIIRE